MAGRRPAKRRGSGGRRTKRAPPAEDKGHDLPHEPAPVLNPPAKLEHAPLNEPAAHIDAIATADDATEALASAFSAGASTGLPPDAESEFFLLAAGLEGANVYDLRRWEEHVDAELAAATDADLLEDEAMHSFDSGDSLARHASIGGSFARHASVGGSFARHASVGGSFARQSSFGGSFARQSISRGSLSRQSSLGGSFARHSSVDVRSSSFGGHGGSFGGRRASVSAAAHERLSQAGGFQERAKRLSERHATQRGVSTKDTVEEARREALRNALEARPARPRPTTITDISAVLGWLEKHVGDVAQTAAHPDVDKPPPPSAMEGLLSAWAGRAKGKVRMLQRSSVGSEASDAANDRPTRTAGDRSLAAVARAAVVVGRSAIADKSPPAEVGMSVWERQAALEKSVAASVAKERRRRHELREEARRARRGVWGGARDSESSLHSASDGAESFRSEPDAAEPWAEPTADESISRFLESLPLLEQRKERAKQECLAAERVLRAKLGHKPAEFERRDDEAWARAALAFREADQALFVARSLTSWDD